MKFMARGLFGLVILTLTLGILAIAGKMMFQSIQKKSAGKHRPRIAKERVFSVEVKPITLQDYAPLITTFGEVISGTTLELRAAAGGELVQLSPKFREGGTVKQGELLFQTDPSNAQSNLKLAETQLIEAKTDQDDALRDLAISKDEVIAAEAQLTLRQQALDRQKSLRERGIGTDSALETTALAAASAQQAVLARKLAVSQAKSRIAKAKTTISRREISLDEARRQLDRTTVNAEFNGILSGVSAVQGRLVNANEKLGSLIDPAALEVSFRVSNAEFFALGKTDRALQGTAVTVRFTGLDTPLHGTVERVSAAVGTGQTGRELFAGLDQNAAAALRPGDFVTVELREPALQQVTVIPAKAVAADGEVLLIGPDNKLEAAHVTVLRKQGEVLVVRAKKLAGRLLVQARAPQLGPGIRVETQQAGKQSKATPPETVQLTDAQRTRLISFVQDNKKIPKARKQALLQKLKLPNPPRAIIERLNARMGG